MKLCARDRYRYMKKLNNKIKKVKLTPCITQTRHRYVHLARAEDVQW